jgi:hypothetical protein
MSAKVDILASNDPRDAARCMLELKKIIEAVYE